MQKIKLPYEGDPNYSYEKSNFKLFQLKNIKKLNAVFIQLDSDSVPVKELANVVPLPLEVSTTEDINKVIQSVEKQPIILVCRTYGGCFHVQNFAYLLQQNKLNFLGAYDVTGEFLKN